MKRAYMAPSVETYSYAELQELIEAAACSTGFTCYCHNGNTYC